ncbi:ankyrin repeat domain-containing protein 24 [Salvelinus namaycush]|uniref:Ankyrin repeat domain-containing protein 24 n=1 Tax=Salvelinus namaycush TaxID=8040 RepID=A0A8U0R495_SALNM|nr:ankyrin repeat domain-containing protein 24 [Salvelinus namaycush]
MTRLSPQSQDWSKSDERLLQAVGQNEPDKGHLDCLEVILAHGPDINVTDGSAVSGCLSCTETLWDCKASLDAQDGDGVSPLILGAQMSRVELCAFLLDRGANPNIQDNQGRSALMLACKSDSAETVERQPPPPPPLPGGTTPRKRQAPPPPRSPPQSSPPPASPSAQSPETRRSNQANLNEEVFEEIRRLRLERGRLLQKIKGLEQQQNSAPTAVEELTQLRECLEQAEAERDRLQTELEELKAGQVIGASDSDDDILDFPGAEKLLSRRSRESPSALDEEEADSPNSTSPGPADPDTVAELCRQVDELTSQNQELVLKVQMLEMFEKDDPDMQTTGPDFVPRALYDSLRREFEALQERYSQAQASSEASSMAGEGKELRERLCGKEEQLAHSQSELERQLAHSQSELEELREQVHLRVYSGEQAGGMGGERETPRGSSEVVSLETQQLREKLEGELRDCVPCSEMVEVQVTLRLQCEQLARERSEASLRLNKALLELERLRPPSPTHCQGDEEERSEGSESSITSERSLRRVREELEVARQEAAQAPDCLCAEREGRSQDTLHLRHAVPLSQHTEALTALSEQLAQTAQELQAERALRCHAQTETARLEAQLQATQQDLIPWEEHDKVKAELQRSLQASENSAAETKEALRVKETELRDLRSQKAVEQGLVSKEDHESQRLSLQAEINAFTAQFNNLTRKHEKTCTEVFQVQREALFNKSECQVAEAQLATAQQQLADLQAQSSHVQELHKDIQDSQALVKENDRKVRLRHK